jgi:hypothetical protein
MLCLDHPPGGPQITRRTGGTPRALKAIIILITRARPNPAKYPSGTSVRKVLCPSFRPRNATQRSIVGPTYRFPSGHLAVSNIANN